jgi:hypothetical protein
LVCGGVLAVKYSFQLGYSQNIVSEGLMMVNGEAPAFGQGFFCLLCSILAGGGELFCNADVFCFG